MPFHVELKDGREAVRAFNLTEEAVVTRFITPLRAGLPFTIQEQDFDPRKARLTIYEGRELGPGELGVGGVGWANAAKRGEDVTQRFLAEGGGTAGSAVSLELSGRLKERILGRLAAGPLPLVDGLSLTGDLMGGHRVSERLGAFEMAVWELLHAGDGRSLTVDGETIPRERWETVILDGSTWLGGGPVVALV